MDVLEDLEGLLPSVPAGVESRRIGAHLASTLQVVKDIDRQTTRLSDCIDVMQEARVPRSKRFENDLDELLDAVDELAGRMGSAQTSEDLRAAAELYSKFIRALGRFQITLREEVRAVMDREFGGLLAIGRVFESIEGTSDLGLRIVSCAEEAHACGERVAIDQLASTVRRLRATRTALDAERATLAKDPEVGTFLNALMEQRATLRMVTPSVRQWLEDHGALDDFVVRGA